MSGTVPLGEFLRTRRERLSPEDVGLVARGQRRVLGLRREEVSLLAGISVEYYIRLEQGRERNPSAAVLDSLAVALCMDNDEFEHLYDLARPKPQCADTVACTAVPEGTVRLLAATPHPAVVQNKYMDVLAANGIAEALSPNMRAGVNRLRAVFLDPREREWQRDWEQATANSVAQLRSAIGGDIRSSPAEALVAELTAKSPEFRDLWSRNDVERRPLSPIRLRHPRLSDLELYREKLFVAGTDGLVLVVYHAAPNSPSEAALSTLARSVLGMSN
jgi:transcriptional regulator with XRE-family HTH domain